MTTLEVADERLPASCPDYRPDDLFAQLEDGPFGQGPPLRSFWCGELVEGWNLRGPVAERDFVSIATFKRPADLVTLEAIEQYKGVKDNHLLSGGWGMEVSQTNNLSELAPRDPRRGEAVEDALRATFSEAVEPKIWAVIPDRAPENTRLGEFCGFIYPDKAVCFLFNVTQIPGANVSYSIDEYRLT